jgi:hypothetical protein
VTHAKLSYRASKIALIGDEWAAENRRAKEFLCGSGAVECAKAPPDEAVPLESVRRGIGLRNTWISSWRTSSRLVRIGALED